MVPQRWSLSTSYPVGRRADHYRAFGPRCQLSDGQSTLAGASGRHGSRWPRPGSGAAAPLCGINPMDQRGAASDAPPNDQHSLLRPPETRYNSSHGRHCCRSRTAGSEVPFDALPSRGRHRDDAHESSASSSRRERRRDRSSPARLVAPSAGRGARRGRWTAGSLVPDPLVIGLSHLVRPIVPRLRANNAGLRSDGSPIHERR